MSPEPWRHRPPERRSDQLNRHTLPLQPINPRTVLLHTVQFCYTRAHSPKHGVVARSPVTRRPEAPAGPLGPYLSPCEHKTRVNIPVRVTRPVIMASLRSGPVGGAPGGSGSLLDLFPVAPLPPLAPNTTSLEMAMSQGTVGVGYSGSGCATPLAAGMPFGGWGGCTSNPRTRCNSGSQQRTHPACRAPRFITPPPPPRETRPPSQTAAVLLHWCEQGAAAAGRYQARCHQGGSHQVRLRLACPRMPLSRAHCTTHGNPPDRGMGQQATANERGRGGRPLGGGQTHSSSPHVRRRRCSANPAAAASSAAPRTLG